MASFTAAGNEAILSAYDFSSFSEVVDVGGGDGSLIADILEINPAVRGIVFDLPHTIMHAQQLLQAAGLMNRCQAVCGRFLRVGAGFYAGGGPTARQRAHASTISDNRPHSRGQASASVRGHDAPSYVVWHRVYGR